MVYTHEKRPIKNWTHWSNNKPFGLGSDWYREGPCLRRKKSRRVMARVCVNSTFPRALNFAIHAHYTLIIIIIIMWVLTHSYPRHNTRPFLYNCNFNKTPTSNLHFSFHHFGSHRILPVQNGEFPLTNPLTLSIYLACFCIWMFWF